MIRIQIASFRDWFQLRGGEQVHELSNDVPNMMLGDMMVVGRPPAKLSKALAVIASELHQGFEAQPRIKSGISKESCVLCSLAVRDFLRAVGFVRAQVVPACTIMWAARDGVQLHSLGIGSPTDTRVSDELRWCGHMVVSVVDYLIDTTLYRAKRPAWPVLPGMMTLPRCAHDHRERWEGLSLIAGAVIGSEEDADYRFTLSWFDNPGNTSWRTGPDCERARRKPVVDAMIERFGELGGIDPTKQSQHHPG